MSQTRAWSWRHAIIKSDLAATTRHVLLTISCFMNELGDGCYPTQEQLAEATGLSERAVRAHLETAEQAGWIKRQEHGFKGQRWRNHEYFASWPETQDVDEGAEPRSGPSDEGAEPPSKSCGTSFQKVRNHVPPTSPVTTPDTSPPSAQARGGGDFNILWDGWPRNERPDSFDAAQAIFDKLPADDQRMAIDLVKTFVRAQALRKKRALMISYLRQRLFAEHYGAPPLDADGEFVITPDRPEWSEWLGSIRDEFGEPGVQSAVRHRKIVRKTRWPERQRKSAA